MSIEAQPPEEGQAPSPDAERKLWLDYLAKLNDRQLQSARASGITTWVLLGVAAAILYKSVPQLPEFLSAPGTLGSSLIILMFEVDALLFLSLIPLYLVYFCRGDVQGRLFPETKKRERKVITWIMSSVLLALTVTHFSVAAKIDHPTFVQWTLLGFGGLFAYNFYSWIRKTITKRQQAKKYNIPLPEFDAMEISPNIGAIIGVVIILPLAIIPTAALILYLHSLGTASPEWIMPLSAATQFLIFCVVLFVLLERNLSSVSKAIFDQLERDVLLEYLAPAEIKSRFIAQALGPSIADWLKSLEAKFKDSEERMKKLGDSLQDGLKEIEAVNKQFPLERKGRAQKLLLNWKIAMKEEQEKQRGYNLQLSEFFHIHTTKKENAVFKNMLVELEAQLGRIMAEAKPIREARKKLEDLAE